MVDKELSWRKRFSFSGPALQGKGGAPVMRDFLGGMSQSGRRQLKELATAKNKLLKK